MVACDAMESGDREILADFDRARAKTIALLAKVPPRMLSRKAAGEEGTLGELFHHIAAVVDGWMLRCMNDGGPPPPAYKPGKAARAKALRSSHKRLQTFFNANGGAAMDTVFRRERDGRQYAFIGRNRVCYLTQHEVHHRGKIILALRQWGMTKIPFMPFDNKPVKQ